MSIVVGPASYMGGDQCGADLRRPELEFACGGDDKVVIGGLGLGLKNKFGKGGGLGLDLSDATSSSSSSSIGRPDDDDTADEVQSTLSLGTLEDSLPIKKGLSKHYAGKSKSFGNLAEVRCVNEMVKPENPFNKRRRTLMALNLHNNNRNSLKQKRNKKSAAFYSHSSHISMPLLPLQEDDDGAADAHHVYDNDDSSSDENAGVRPSFFMSSSHSQTGLGRARLQQIQEHHRPPFPPSSSSLSVNVNRSNRQTG